MIIRTTIDVWTDSEGVRHFSQAAAEEAEAEIMHEKLENILYAVIPRAEGETWDETAHEMNMRRRVLMSIIGRPDKWLEAIGKVMELRG